MNRRVEQYKPKKRYRKGTITLCNAYTDRVVKSIRYRDRWDRRGKTDRWEKIFGPNFHNNYFVLIEPDVNITDEELKEFEEKVKINLEKTVY